MPASPDEFRAPLDAFLPAFRADIDADAVRPLAEYVARFPGDDAAIAREYRASIRQTTTAGGVATGDAAGDRIAHYRLLREIGRGGQGVVYLAEDTRLHRKVALKVLKGMASLSEDSLARFRREAEAASRLDHPGICAVYEAALDGHVPYIAMRLVEGESLAAKIASAKVQDDASTDTSFVHLSEVPAPPAPAARPGTDPSPTPSGPTTRAEIMRVVQLIEKVARALHAAHEAGVIHRDMKPGNVMVTPEGEAVIMDFGLAHLEDDDLPTLTQTGEVPGTPAYMSPEQLLAQLVRLDRRTDVWSLGVLLYECVTLARPFDAPTREGVYQAIQTKDPLDPRRLNRSVPAEIGVVIETALEKDRDRRYQTALDLAEELRRVRCFEPIRAKPAGPILRLRRWAQRSPVVATSLGSVLTILVVALGFSLVILDQKSAAAAENERAAERLRLDDLISLEQDLWPGTPDEVATVKGWIAAASTLASQLPKHREAFERFREQAPVSIAESRPGQRALRFESNQEYQDQFRNDTTAKLVTDLAAFADPDPAKGLLAAVRTRLAIAESLDLEGKWSAAIRSIADGNECPKYGGRRIKPQAGLIPLGQDPQSRLWEFVHVRTTGPGPDRLPVRGKDGRLVVAENMGLVFVLIPGGTFSMGAITPDESRAVGMPNVDPKAQPLESPVREIALEPFFLSKYELTQAQWLRNAARNPSSSAPGSGGGQAVDLRHPVENVSWEDCDSWLQRVRLVLPTEAQWECAARGGTTTPRWTDGLEKPETCELSASRPVRIGAGVSEGKGPRAVGSLAANPFGLYDVLGNVSEWCRDDFANYSDPVGPGDGLRGSLNGAASLKRVVRGSKFDFEDSTARSAFRDARGPADRDPMLGVRPARLLDR